MKLKSGAALSKAMEAEGDLARRNARRIEEKLAQLPDDDPVKQEARKQKMMLGGDLAGLPPGHPLIKMLEDAKARYESEQVTGETEQAPGPQLKKARKLDERKRIAARIVAEEEKTRTRRAAMKDLKQSMETTLVAVRTVKDAALQSAEVFQGDQFAQMKIQRYARMAMGIEKWLLDGMAGIGRMA